MSEESDNQTGIILDLGACVAHPAASSWKRRAEEAQAEAEHAWKTVDFWRERALAAEKLAGKDEP